MGQRKVSLRVILFGVLLTSLKLLNPNSKLAHLASQTLHVVLILVVRGVRKHASRLLFQIQPSGTNSRLSYTHGLPNRRLRVSGTTRLVPRFRYSSGG
jgi:hypothetical protein